MSNQQKRIESLYVLKCISSFFVVLIHTELYNKEMLNFIAGIGTPCFLAITGYLLYSNDKEKEIQKCFKWAKKTFLLVIVYNLVYYLVRQFYFHNMPETDIWFWWKNFQMGNRICFSLWYLTALWESLLIISFIIKYIPKLIYVLPFFFIIIYLMRNTSDGFIPFSIPLGSRLSIWTSLPFLATGYLIRKHYACFANWKIEFLTISILIIAIAENLYYAYFLGHRGLFHLSTYPLIVSVFLLCIKYPDFQIPVINYIGKHLSPNIYYFHVLVIMFWSDLGFDKYNDYQAICIWLLCIPLAMLIKYISGLFSRVGRRLVAVRS